MAITRTLDQGFPSVGVQVDEHVVGPLDVVHPAVPRVQIDAAEVRDPGEARRIRDHREVGRAPASREENVYRLEPFGVRVGDALLVEKFAVDSVRIAEHLHRAVPDVREDVLGEIDVVLDEVTLRQSALGEEDLVEIRDRNVVPADPHPAEGRDKSPFVGKACLGRERDHGSAGSPHITRRLVTASSTVCLCGSIQHSWGRIAVC
jgi:hypothetical protein